MPSREYSLTGALASILILLCSCKGDGGSTHDSSHPRTNIDLAVTGFSVSPSAADPEDDITVSGTIQNLGTETANPMPGDRFSIRFNLSKDGTFELKEQGFLEEQIASPIPPGGTLPFTYTAPYGGGDTLSIFGIFCNCAGPDCCRQQLQTGVIGVKLDSVEEINELDEGNNFGFDPIQAVGTLVAATGAGCDVGGAGSSGSGCYLMVSDDLNPAARLQRPCVGCSPTEIVLPNELHRFITVTLGINGCTNNQVPNGSCGAGWTIVTTTSKPGLPVSTRSFPMTCVAAYSPPPGGSGNVACSQTLEIRDLNY